jgi:hypothetical protein
VFMVAYVAVGNYAILNIGRRIAALTAIGAFIEFVIAGIVLGAVYKPSTQAKPMRAGAL